MGLVPEKIAHDLTQPVVETVQLFAKDVKKALKSKGDIHSLFTKEHRLKCTIGNASRDMMLLRVCSDAATVMTINDLEVNKQGSFESAKVSLKAGLANTQS